MADLIPNGLHEMVMICSKRYITKSRCTVFYENPLGNGHRSADEGSK